MEAFFIINICVAVVLLFWPVYFSRVWLGLSWVNPLSIVFVVALPVQIMKLVGGPLVLIDDGLYDHGFQFAVLMGSLQTLMQAFGLVFFYILFAGVRVERLLPFRKVFLSFRDLRRAQIAFMLIYVFAMLLLASSAYGVVNWFVNPREGYQLYRAGQGHWYALAVSSLSISFVLALLARPRPRSVLWATLLYLFCGYFLGSKGALLSIFTTAAIFLWFLNWRHLGRVIFFGMPLIFGLLLLNLFLALSDGFALQSVVEYFDYYKNAADYYRAYLSGEISLFRGDVLMSSLWGYVPRAVWADKPFVYGVLLVNEIFYPGQAELTNTPAFGGAVEQFADFGVLGVIVLSFFSSQSLMSALLVYLIFKRPRLDFQHVSLATVMLVLVQFGAAFGSYFPGGVYIFVLFAALGTIRLLRIRRFRSVGFGKSDK